MEAIARVAKTTPSTPGGDAALPGPKVDVSGRLQVVLIAPFLGLDLAQES